MELIEHVYSVLIVSSSEKFNSSISGVFPRSNYSPIVFEKDVSSAKRAISERGYDFIVINSPLTDSDGIRFAIDASTDGNSVVTVLVKNDIYESVYAKISRYGVYALPKPIEKQSVARAVDWMTVTRERLRRVEKKNVSLEDKMKEIRLTNRAKWILITELNMSEEEAHRYIEKQAMDRCVSKSVISEEIIKTYV